VNRLDPDDQEAALLRAGRKIEAIRALRQRTGIGLKDARDAVNLLERQLGLERPGSATAKSLLFWTVLIIVAILVWRFASSPSF
jgi:hypothetical protein